MFIPVFVLNNFLEGLIDATNKTFDLFYFGQHHECSYTCRLMYIFNFLFFRKKIENYEQVSNLHRCSHFKICPHDCYLPTCLIENKTLFCFRKLATRAIIVMKHGSDRTSWFNQKKKEKRKQREPWFISFGSWLFYIWLLIITTYTFEVKLKGLYIVYHRTWMDYYLNLCHIV